MALSAEAARLHRDALVWDNTFPFDETCGDDEAHLNSLERMRASGFDFVSLTIGGDFGDVEPTIRRIAQVHALIRRHGNSMTLCYTADDIVAAKRAGTLGLGLHFQGTNAFGRDVAMVEIYYRLGVRHALLAYNQKNAVGDGCHERTDAGLSRFGVDLIKEMNRVGMLVDCTHSGYRTTMEAMELSTAPVIFSHSNVRALVDHERNIRDDQILACAKTGGVIGVTGVGLFIGDNDASTENILRQIDYIADLVGPRHIGIGLDFVSDIPKLMRFVRAQAAMYPDGSYEVPAVAFATPEQVPDITEGLLRRSWPERDIRGVLGENFLRVAQGVWR